LVADASLCGVQLAGEGASVDLTEGEVNDCGVGACIQVTGYDLGRLSQSVRYRGNGTALEITELPVPQAAVDSDPLE
jgi:hypothetical protein